MTVVSVIMPTYNASTWVTSTIDSVIAQTYPHVEFIVVDDGSKDDTVAVVRDKLTREFRNHWQIIELGANRGPAAARNAGLSVASGSWVQFIDGDDLIPPEKFARQMAYCSHAPADVTAIYSPWRRCYIDNGQITWDGEMVEPDMEGRPPIMCLVGVARPLLSAGLARRDVLQSIGGFDETLRFWECEEITFRLAREGRFARVDSPEPCYLWRMHRGKTYIGGETARYKATAVVLSWMEQVLRAAEHRPASELGLSPADQRALLDDCTFWGRMLYSQDRTAFRRYIAMARELDPDITPTYPRLAVKAARCIGYEAAEGLFRLVQTPRSLARATLRRVGLRQQKSPFDW